MPLDGIYIYSIVNELKNKLIGCRVDKISQPEKDEIVFALRGDRINYKLLVSASSSYPKIHITNVAKPNPEKAPMFCMVLRKYLSTAKIIDITQLSTDRIIVIDFESSDELGFNSVYSIVVEIMGRHSNITLLRKRDNIVIDSIKHMTPDINTYRSLYPGIKYVFPPDSEKLNPFLASMEDLEQFLDAKNIKIDTNFFSKVFTGISSQFSKSMYLLMSNSSSIDVSSIKDVYNFMIKMTKPLKDNYFNFITYYDETSVKDFYCTDMYQYADYKQKSYDSPSKHIEDFYYEKDKSERLNIKSSDLQKIIHNNIDRCTKKIDILNKTLLECEEKDTLRIYGELLTSNIYSIKKGDKNITVLNYYSEAEEYINIPLDENKSPSENIQHYYKKYNKLKRSGEMAEIQIDSTKHEMDYLQSVLTNIKNSESYDEIEEIKRELIETGYIKYRKENNKKLKVSKPIHYISSDGIDIYIGKNNIQNDYLTLKFADKNNIWLHTKNIPGSHVIIKNNGKVPDSTLSEAAILAAYYSKGKDSTKVPVDYTEVKNVKKPSGAKPGMVIYYTNRTLYVNPEKLDLKKLE